MKLNLNIHYNTSLGQTIYVSGSSGSMGVWNISKAVKMNYIPEGNWSVVIDILENVNLLEYKYLLLDEQGI